MSGPHEPLATFEVETVPMPDGRSVRYYIWPARPDGSPAAPEAAEPGPLVDPAVQPDSAAAGDVATEPPPGAGRV